MTGPREIQGLTEAVGNMPEAVKTPSRQPSWLTLNSDGQSHPVLNIMSVITLVVGVAAFATGLIVSTRAIAIVLGIVGLGVGMGAQMFSATREERIIIVTGIIGAVVGLGLGVGHGGF